MRKNSRLFPVLLFVLVGFGLSAQNQVKTAFIQENLWYQNPGAINSDGGFNANILYSYEPSFFEKRTSLYSSERYSVSRVVVGLDYELPVFKELKLLNPIIGISGNFLAPNGGVSSNFNSYPNGGNETYSELGINLANKFVINDKQFFSIGGYYRNAQYEVDASHQDYMDEEGGIIPPWDGIPVRKNIWTHVVGFGANYYNEINEIQAGISVDNSPMNMRTIFKPGLPTEANPSYFENRWSINFHYNMKIPLNKNLSIAPGFNSRIDYMFLNVDVALKLYLKDKYYVGAVFHGHGGYFSAVAGVEFDRLDFGVSYGTGLNKTGGIYNSNIPSVNAFLKWKILK